MMLTGIYGIFLNYSGLFYENHAGKPNLQYK